MVRCAGKAVCTRSPSLGWYQGRLCDDERSDLGFTREASVTPFGQSGPEDDSVVSGIVASRDDSERRSGLKRRIGDGQARYVWSIEGWLHLQSSSIEQQQYEPSDATGGVHGSATGSLARRIQTALATVPQTSPHFGKSAMTDYRWRTASEDGFARQAVQYFGSGHYFYFADSVGSGVDLDALDHKLLELYGCEVKPWTRSRNKARGRASVHYLRYGSFITLLSTSGAGPFFEELGEQRDKHGLLTRQASFKDARRESLIVGPYSIRHTLCQNSRVSGGVRTRRPKHHTLVRLNKPTYESLKANMVDRATRSPRGRLEEEFWSLGFYPFRPVIDQLMVTVRAVNRARARQGLLPLDHKRCVRRRRTPEPVFAETTVSKQAA